MESPNNLDTNGSLRINPLAELLTEIRQNRFSGSLRIAHADQKIAFYFDAGENVFAVSNARRHRLFEVLLQSGKMTKDQLIVIPEFTNDFALQEFLIKDNLFSKIEVDAFFSGQMLEIIRTAVEWREGDWTFSPLVRIKGDIRFAVDQRNALAESARNVPVEDAARKLLNPQESFRVKAEMPLNVNLTPHESFVYSRFENAPLTLAEIQTVSGLREAETRHVVYILWLGGFLERENWSAAFSERKVAAMSAARLAVKKEETPSKTVLQTPEIPPAAAVAVPESEPPAEVETLPSEKQISLDAYLERTEQAANFYDLFALAPDAAASEIKQAYFGLAKRFHPDLYHKESDTTLVARIQGAFSRLAQAYDTLKTISSRDVYDFKMRKELAEIKAVQQAQTTHEEIDVQKQIDQAAENFERGFDFLVDGNHDAAMPYLARAAHLAKNNARYQAYLGKALSMDNKQRHKAENALHTAVKLDGENADYRLMLAEFYVDFNLLKRAEGELNRLLTIFPDHREAKTLLDSLSKK